jgi:hypothetical protein
LCMTCDYERMQYFGDTAGNWAWLYKLPSQTTTPKKHSKSVRSNNNRWSVLPVE